MADVVIRRSEKPALFRCRRQGEEIEKRLSLAKVRSWIRCGWDVSIVVEGWREPWPISIVGSDLRARCPTAPKVFPTVIEEGPFS